MIILSCCRKKAPTCCLTYRSQAAVPRYTPLPALRERVEDIPLLAALFLQRFVTEYGRNVQGFSSNAMDAFLRYPRPGNAGELENVIGQAFFKAKGEIIGIKDLPIKVILGPGPKKDGQGSPYKLLKQQLEDPEKQIILTELQERGGNIRETAHALNVSRTTLYTKLKKFGINPDSLRS
jgi:DNA-binding NtrC family response regulator